MNTFEDKVWWTRCSTACNLNMPWLFYKVFFSKKTIKKSQKFVLTYKHRQALHKSDQLQQLTPNEVTKLKKFIKINNPIDLSISRVQTVWDWDFDSSLPALLHDTMFNRLISSIIITLWSSIFHVFIEAVIKYWC